MKASATAFTSGFVFVFCLASTSAQLPVIPSFNKPHKPLGSARVMAALATIGEARTRLHSSGVKFKLSAIMILLERRAEAFGMRG
jgi:hypothetical protein